MTIYTTGELAKKSGISIRALQYYDQKEILKASHWTDGGKRNYTEEDYQKLKFILFLKDLGLSLKSIKEVLEEEKPERVLSLLIKQQKQLVFTELSQKKEQYYKLELLEKQLPSTSHLEELSEDGLRKFMDKKKKLKSLRLKLVSYGLAMNIIEFICLFFGIRTGYWWPLIVGLVVVTLIGYQLCIMYYREVLYVCPQDNETFRPMFKEFFFSKHTPKTRKLTCPHCHHKGYCVEVYDDNQ